MCIYTDVPRVVVVIFVAEGTPDCLKMEQVEIGIALHLM
jgi:hypothetical protein